VDLELDDASGVPPDRAAQPDRAPRPDGTVPDLQLDPSWAVGGRPHGGYLLRRVVERVLTAEHPHPMAVSAHFARSPLAAEPVAVDVERLRVGRRVASSRARLSQAGEPCVEVLISHGTLTAAEPRWTDGDPGPVLPAVEDCVTAPANSGAGTRIGHLDHVDLRLDLSSYDTPGTEVRAWLQRADRAAPSVLDLLVFADAMPPVTFGLGMVGWAPTVELTVLLRSLPAAGWLKAVQRGRLLQDGWLDEDCDLYDSTGRLVAQARQLAGYRES